MKNPNGSGNRARRRGDEPRSGGTGEPRLKKSAQPGGSSKELISDGETERAFARVVDAFRGDGEVTFGGGKGFGSGALKVRRRIFAMLSSKAQFVAKLPRERVEELVQQGTGRNFDPGRGRPMKEWIALDGAYSLWIRLAKEARRFVGGATS